MELLISIITALILLTAFMFLIQKRIHSMINTFTCQSALLALVVFLHAIKEGEIELYISALLTIVLKVIFIPYLLKYFVRNLNIRHNVAKVKRPFWLLLGASVLTLFCHRLIMPIHTTALAQDNSTITVAMSVMLLGMLLLITHHKAISHIIGFMSMENGIFFAALIATRGMPMVVELGIAFDVLVAVTLFGIFFLQLRRSIGSLDVDRLNLLREDVE